MALGRAWAGLAGEAARRLRVCVVGSGPAGMYCAQNLLKKAESERFAAKAKVGGGEGGNGSGGLLDVRVDVVDRRPTPGGLARYGVAPDHADHVAPVLDNIDRVLGDDRVRFFGNVHITEEGAQAQAQAQAEVDLRELRQIYDAVVLAHGADQSNWLGIAGERELKGRGVTSARDLVAHYCGDPLAAHDNPFFYNSSGGDNGGGEVREAVVVGAGNVALDVARMLLSAPSSLHAETDTAARFVAMLRPGGSLAGVQRVHVLARRGPKFASFAPKELREILSKRPLIRATVVLPQVHAQPPSSSSSSSSSLSSEMSPFDGDLPRGAARAQKRVFKLLKDRFESPPPPLEAGEGEGGAKELFLHFLHKPVAFLGEGGRLAGVRIELQEEHGEGGAQIRPLGSSGDNGAGGEGEGEGHVTLPAQLAVVAASQRRVAVAGLPPGLGGSFEERQTPRVLDRVEAEAGAGEDLAPVYLCGWANHGAKGIIGASMVDADEVSSVLLGDAVALPPAAETAASGAKRDLGDLLAERSVAAVSEAGWARIREEQLARGRAAGRASEEKITEVAQMLTLAEDTTQ